MRIYVGCTASDLAHLWSAGQLVSGRSCHAVTLELRRHEMGADDEELEYLALGAAADSSVAALRDSREEPPRRVVLAADVPDEAVTPVGASDVTRTRVTVSTSVALAQVAAVHVDDVGAADAVRAALAGDHPALAEHELLWYARQEIPDVAGVAGRPGDAVEPVPPQ